MNPFNAIRSMIATAAMVAFSFGASASTFEKLSERGLNPKSVVEMPIDGLVAYEAQNGKVFFMTSDGRYVFSGGTVADVWNGSVLETGEDIRISSNTIPLENMEIDFDMLDALEVGNGDKVVHIITDPACPACKKLADQLPEFTDEYTFKILALPALGEISQELSRRIACETDRDAAAKALLNGTANQLPAPENCNLDAYNQALLVADYIRVREVPFLIGPNDIVNRGLPKDLGGWLKEASSFLPAPKRVSETQTMPQAGTTTARGEEAPGPANLNTRLRNALN